MVTHKRISVLTIPYVVLITITETTIRNLPTYLAETSFTMFLHVTTTAEKNKVFWIVVSSIAILVVNINIGCRSASFTFIFFPKNRVCYRPRCMMRGCI